MSVRRKKTHPLLGSEKVHFQGKSSTVNVCLTSQREEIGNSLYTTLESSIFPRAVYLH